jgi:hypothetical protein
LRRWTARFVLSRIGLRLDWIDRLTLDSRP